MAFSVTLSADSLDLDRGGRRIVAGASLRLGPGEAILLRGPNGAGKTTLLRALAGLLAPAAGTVEVEGASQETACAFCGVKNVSKASLTVDENMRFWSALYRTAPERIDFARKTFALEPFSSRRAGELSTGYARRLGLARLAISARPIWLIDEPVAGLDAPSAQMFEALIANHRAQGGAAVIATHDPVDAPNVKTMEMRAS
ncbi:MAG: heme ABC exporter ATP-binding protein CcmA [Pseudomonadota bacterium]